MVRGMKTSVPFGPNRGLKKPRGWRAKASVRRLARLAAYARTGYRPMTERALRRMTRHALLRRGRPSRDLRGIEVHREHGLITILLRTMPVSVARQVVDSALVDAPVAVAIGWRFV